MTDPLSELEPGSAQEAVARAREALGRGDAERALAWFGRAARLVPDDPMVAFLRASALMASDLSGAMAALDAVCAAHPSFQEARILRLACAVRADDAPMARAELARFLGSNALPSGVDFRRLADLVASLSRDAGWVGLDGVGGGLLSLVSRRGRPRVELMLDGEVLTAVPGADPGSLKLKLPRGWRDRLHLSATCQGRALLGSPIDVQQLLRTEGFVTLGPDGAPSGWAWQPGIPGARAALLARVRDLETGGRTTLRIVTDPDPLPDERHDAGQRRGFRLDPAQLPAWSELRLFGAGGEELTGSPLIIGRERRASRAAAARLARRYSLLGESVEGDVDPWYPLDASLLAPGRDHSPPAHVLPPKARLDIVIPVFKGEADFTQCLATLAGHVPKSARIVVIDDGSRDVALLAALARAERDGEIVVLRHGTNRGFPAAANTGFRHALQDGPRDVLLLNADTLLPAGAVRRLAAAAYADAAIGSVTPMTNNGTIVSYPLRDPPAMAPDLSGVRVRDRQFQAANGAGLVDIPSAVGFCMFIRHDCLFEVGGFRDDVFAQGYGEENDWCLRASHLGWRHVAAIGLYVAHTGGTTFGVMKSYLVARNLDLLNRLHPGYDALIAAFLARDPLAAAREAVDLARWTAGRVRGGAVLLVSHDMGGGVARHVGERAAAITAQGQRAILLRPSGAGDGEVSDLSDPDAPVLLFRLPDQRAALAALLRQERLHHMELHHFIGFRIEIATLADLLGVPMDMYVHDYGLLCPRVTLVGDDDRYCGEPALVSACVACVEKNGERLRDAIGVAELRARSAGWLASARQVIVPSRDTGIRINRHFPNTSPQITPWEQEAEALRLASELMPPRFIAKGTRVRIVIAGAIGIDKGYEVLLAAAQDAADRALDLEFVVVGFTMDDKKLMDTGRVFITGKFAEEEGAALVTAQQGHVGLIPSIWPETWCYALSVLWRGGLRVAAFDLGAQAERIRKTGAGSVLPLGLPAPRVNDVLLALALA